MNTPLLALTSRNWLVVAVLTTALGNGVAQAGTQLRYEGSGVGCGVLDRTGAFLESYACMTTLTFDATDTTTAAGVYVVHYAARAAPREPPRSVLGRDHRRAVLRERPRPVQLPAPAEPAAVLPAVVHAGLAGEHVEGLPESRSHGCGHGRAPRERSTQTRAESLAPAWPCRRIGTETDIQVTRWMTDRG